ncbi:MAG: phosphoribosylamine--glycine ligase [Candidatus Diapherotrites archaeon]|nr:phosphoribosylamine--glycine ligase [Candidatus Diapherotrites archaeon]
MKVLVVGSGGREHALVWKIAQSPLVEKVFCAPGNAGTAELAQNVDIAAEEIEKLAFFAQMEGIGLTVVGPEAPLVEGIADEFQKKRLRVFGPSKAAALLEGSKAFAKELMKSIGVPTPKFQIVENIEDAIEAVSKKQKAVVKAHGLAEGKGVFVCKSQQEILDAISKIMQQKIFGHAGDKIIIEEIVDGKEASILAFCDGENYQLMPPAQDHKRVFDGNRGQNTGGMGAYSPVPLITTKLLKEIEDTIVKPIISEMGKRGTPYVGVLYVGIMIVKGKPFVLEFNCRFGDPEAQVVLLRLESDLVEIMLSCIEKKLSGQKIVWSKKAATCVVLASGGYPEKFDKGKKISGLEEVKKMKETIVFHSATKSENSAIVSNSGRVLGVTALGKTVKESIQKAYKAVSKISFEKMHYRKDIGKKMA